MTRLRDLGRCFQGVIPSVIATCSKDGVPNVTFLSQVHFVDDTHVALSFQFFNKTRRNIAENPYASVEIYDPVTLDAYTLSLRFDHSEKSGPLFEAMSARIDAIASQTGMSGVFRLQAADVYEVEALEPSVGFIEPPADDGSAVLVEPPPAHGEMRALQMVSGHLSRARDLDGLLSTLLEALNHELGFEHSMVLLADETGEKLFAVASRGYGESGVGAEVAMGEGLVGTVAERRKTLRFSSLDGELRYGRAIRHAARSAGEITHPEIPLPGLPDAQSHLAIPLVVRDRLIGVLAVEGVSPMSFADWHEEFLDIVGNQAATAIENMLLRERADEADAPATVARAPVAAPKRSRVVTFYTHDDCIFVDGEYLVRNVPGRILWRILRRYVDEGRVDVKNRELRLDTSLGLPAIKDNLESRLILLRKRLEQKCPDIRLVPKARGQLLLEVDVALELVEKSSA